VDERVKELLPLIETFGLGAPTIPEARQRFTRAAAQVPPPDGVTVDQTSIAGIAAVRIRPSTGATAGRILYLHGGGFVIGAAEVQLSVPARLSLATACEVVSIDYRVAPEHPLPAATEDAVAAYKELLDDGPVTAIAGDSAGGALALLAGVIIRDRVLPAADAIVAFSPWTDLSGESPRYNDPGFEDAVLPRLFLSLAADAALDGWSPEDPRVTPLTADLRGLPPTMIHVGGDELVLADSLRLGNRLAVSGVETTLHVWPGMIHVFVAYPQLVPESDQALAEVAAFLDAQRTKVLSD
jgi:epsilon-lactone hydrolase